MKGDLAAVERTRLADRARGQFDALVVELYSIENVGDLVDYGWSGMFVATSAAPVLVNLRDLAAVS